MKQQKLTKRPVAERYSITPRTVDRWTEEGILPAPIQIKNRRYWDQAEIEKRERDRMAAQQSTTA